MNEWGLHLVEGCLSYLFLELLELGNYILFEIMEGGRDWHALD